MLCYYRSRPSQFTVFLPTFPSVLFHGPSNPKPTTFPGSSPNSSPKETLGTSLPQASRGSAIQVFLVYVWMHVSPAEEGRWIGFTITTTVVLHRWHHLYFFVVVDNLYNRLSCQPFFQSYQWQCLTRQFLHLSRKGDKTVRNLVKVLTEKKGSYPPFFFWYFAVLTHAYLGHLIWYKTLIKHFPPIASIRAQFHSRQVLPHHLVKDGHWIFFLY